VHASELRKIKPALDLEALAGGGLENVGKGQLKLDHYPPLLIA